MVRQYRVIPGWSQAVVKVLSTECLCEAKRYPAGCVWCQAHPSPFTSSSAACSSSYLHILSFHFLFFFCALSPYFYLQHIIPPVLYALFFANGHYMFTFTLHTQTNGFKQQLAEQQDLLLYQELFARERPYCQHILVKPVV